MELSTSGMTIQMMLKNAADTFGDKVCIKYEDKDNRISYTYKEYNDIMPFSMNVIGKERLLNNRIIIISKNRELMLRWMLSVMYCGGVAVPLNPEQNNEELKDIITYIEPEAIVLDSTMYSDWEEQLPPELSARLISAEKASYECSATYVLEDVEPDSAAIIVLTSGTTGRQKGVVISNENLCGNLVPPVHQWHKSAGLMNTFTIMPFHHVMAITVDVLMPLMMGGCVTIGDGHKNFLEGLKQSKGNTFSCVPMILEYMLMMLKNERLSNPDSNLNQIKEKVLGPDLRIICCAGSEMDPDVRDEVEMYGSLFVCTGYGMSEITSQISSDIYTIHGKRKRNSIGKISPIIQWKNTETGELLVKGPGMMNGYWNMPLETELVLADGWLHTGDLIDVDEEGYLFFKGRCKNIIITSDGENISPESIEKILARKITDCQLRVCEGNGGLHLDIGLNGKSSSDTLEQLLRNYNEGRPMSWQIRSYCLYEEELEKNLSGKILRDENRIDRNEKIFL